MNQFEEQLQRKIDGRTKPKGSLGRLEELAFRIGKIQHTLTPDLHKPAILLFSADHGIADEGVSPCPKKMTWQMTINFVEGGAGINVFCRQHGIKLKIIDCGVDYDFDPQLKIEHRKLARGTQNMLHQPAMSVELCQKAMDLGAEMVRAEYEQGCNVIGFGEMGIGNTSPASLLVHKFIGTPLEECVGRGAGLWDEGLKHKLEVLTAVANRYNPSTPIDVLATFGGLEIAAICGAVLEAKRLNMLIVADGFITSSGFLAAYEMNPEVAENVIFSHASQEPGHKALVAHMHGDPLLDLGMRLGEGTGVAVAYPIIKSALVFLNEMAGFDETGIHEVEKYR